MNITKIYFNDLNDEDLLLHKNILADVNIDINYDFRIHNIKLVDGKKGPYLIFPQNRMHKFIVYPIKDEVRQEILDKILEEFSKINQ